MQYRAIAATMLAVLVVIPVLVSAADDQESRARSIFNMVIDRLCQIQQEHGNRVILIDPAKCVPPTPPPPPPPPQPGHLIVDKVTQPSGSAAVFSITATGTGAIVGGGSGTTTDSTSKTYEVTAGTYSVTETALAGWMQVGNTCVDVVIGVGETKVCTITNIKLPKLTVTKIVLNDSGGTATTSDFALFVDNATTTSGTQNSYATGTRMVSEGSHTGYTSTIGGDCAADGTVVLAAGDVKSCTITNDDIPPQVEGKLLITEVLYDLTTSTTTPQGDEPGNEWVEIHNGTNTGINLADYFIHDASSSDPLPSVLLPAGKFAVITGSSTTETFWSIPADALFIVLPNTTIGNGLGNSGDMVWLENTASTTVDAVSWGTNTTAFNPSVPTVPANSGDSITRTSVTTDTDTESDWIADSTPTPGS